ncbi:MAG: Bacterial pre-peptidase C-terminal domain [Geminicoccaceae bacterium]|nr:Bacterial pre-peptidase C-terminal domain [Geminicoccaceae bacterium]
MRRLVQVSMRLLTILCVGGWFSSHALAQANDAEPNNSCPAAQDVGLFDDSSPFLVTGSLDTPPEEPDVDFFKLEATPGISVVAELEAEPTGQGTLPDPFLGLFDSDCNLIAANDDSGTLNSRLRFVVPEDGIRHPGGDQLLR